MGPQKEPTATRKCLRCPETIVGKRAQQSATKYCFNCAYKMKLQKNRESGDKRTAKERGEYFRKRKREQKEPIPTRKCLRCPETIVGARARHASTKYCCPECAVRKKLDEYGDKRVAAERREYFRAYHKRKREERAGPIAA